MSIRAMPTCLSSFAGGQELGGGLLAQNDIWTPPDIEILSIGSAPIVGVRT
jgi:hypothetical protein